jgi:hypothetical protein
MRHTIEHFLFEQPNVDFRIFVVRLAVSLLTLSYVIVGPYDYFHADAADLLYRPTGLFSFIPALGRESFYTLKYLVVISGISFLVGYKTRISCAVFAISYFIFAYYVGHFSTQLFSYITHLNFFLFILCPIDTERFWSIDWVRAPAAKEKHYPQARRQLASFALAFMQLYLVAFYVQAGMGKLLASGMDWFLTGATPYYATIVAGTDFGLALTKYPWLFKGFSLFTGFFELCFFLILWKRLRWFYVIGVIGFHFGLLLNLNIFFYQLSALVPLLFVFEHTREYRRALISLAVYFILIAALVAMTPLSSQPLGTSTVPAESAPTKSAPAEHTPPENRPTETHRD